MERVIRFSVCIASIVCFVFFSSCSRESKNVVTYVAPDSVEYEALAKQAAEDTDLHFWSDYPHNVLADELINRMTDEELLAQMYMFGWTGQFPTESVINWVEERGIGSVKLFGWNTDDVNQVAQSVILLQKKSQERPLKIPLYVATDQEGGWIRHVKGRTSETPGNLAIGAAGYPADAYYSGYYIGREMRALGINMNFAPTVDIYTDIDSTVIGPRSFGEDPEQVGILGAAFSAGSLAAGVLSTGKHYPGHGDTSIDSHGRLPIINITKEVFEQRELVPFKYLIAEKVPAIMAGHLAFPNITGNTVPATLSRYFLTDILRVELGYEGLIITDDMEMNGAATYAGSMSTAFRMAIEAGNDILCSSKTAALDAPLWTTNSNQMKNSPEFRNIVRTAAHRIIQSKLDYFKGEDPVPLYPDVSKIAQLIPDPEGQAFFLEQACRSITVTKNDVFPLPSDDAGHVLFVTPFGQFATEGTKRYANSSTFYVKYSIPSEEYAQTEENLRQTAFRADTIVMYIPNADSARLAQVLRNSGKRVIIVSGLSPAYALEDFEWASSIAFIYSYSPYSFEAFFAALNGEFEPEGMLPVGKDLVKHE